MYVVYSDGGWCPEACRIPALQHRLDTHCEKSIVERMVEYFDDYCPCRRKQDYDLFHVYNWIAVFVFLHNARRSL